MIDQSKINLLDLIGQSSNLKKVANTHNGEYAGACPFCGGTDRFLVWPHKRTDGGEFWCRQCNIGGDAIKFVMLIEKIGFRDALRKLSLDSNSTVDSKPLLSSAHKRHPSTFKSKSSAIALSSDEWQINALQFVRESANHLWDPANPAGLTYLRNRGISDEVTKAATLGYNPHNQRLSWSKELDRKVWLPRGIVIPWFEKGRLIKVNQRRLDSDPQPKYIQAAGGTNGLYSLEPLKYEETLLLTEGEFDTLSLLSSYAPLLQELNIRPVATGSTSGGRDYRWLFKVAASLRVLIAFDTDEAGENASNWWISMLGSRATRLRPLGHDICDMIQDGHDVEAWLRQSTT